ncbi:hypothetical protein [Modicisalibacter sp. MOD 31.J]|uniref:beta strand repeat-containing protein n=1 Tax=Modicisalibacter sp. MOD 31.J TaxID=2831897 RepID=UPI001CCD9A3A|nr:hypothetical protein [Modicisalibacter sp. MOD 31.J]MBZ9573717.1 hypothetical protein [Modicisalibacter sp. MOD 31.J]
MATINFDSQFYLEQKLAQLQKQDSAEYGDWTTENVQQAFDDAGLTAEQHYEMYGYIEGLSPNIEFDSTEYLKDKLAQLQESGATQANGEAYETIADVANAFQAAGLSPLEHYNQYGQDEGLTATPVTVNPPPPRPDYTIDFDSSEKDGTVVTVDDSGNLQLTQEDQGDLVKHVGKAQYDETGSYNTTADYQFTLSNQLNYGVDDTTGETVPDLYQATFLSPLMVESGGQDQGSVLDLRFADRLAPADDTTETLNNTQINYFEFTVNGTKYQINDEVTDGALSQARDYPELLQAIQAGVASLKAANPDLSGLSVRQGNTFSVDQYDEADNLTGEQVKGISVVLSLQEGELGGFTANVSSADEGGVDSYARAFNEITDGVDGMIQTSLALDNVGYGSQGGSVNLAGESNTNVGIEKFVVTTKNGAWLTELSSSDTDNNGEYNHLKVVEVTGSSYFRVGQQSATWGHSTTAGEYFTANGQTANWVSPFVADETGGNQGLNDVQDLDLTGVSGSSAINAAISDAVIDRDLNLVDVNGDPADDNVVYEYDLTGGDDVLNLNVSANVLEHEDFELEIDTGTGNDVVHFSNGLADGASSALVNQQLNDNVSIETGAGNDRVWSEGAGNANISTGVGDDLVLADNSGAQLLTGDITDAEGNVIAATGSAAGLNEGRAQFVFNNATTNIRDLESNSDADLSDGANGNAQSFTVGGFAANASSNTFSIAVNFMGYEATTDINIATSNINGGNATITALQINQAIKEAINGDDVLKELLLAKDGNGNSLIVDSKIDGAMELSDLNIEFTSTNVVNGTSTETAITLAAQADTDGYYETQFATDDLNGDGTVATDGSEDLTGADSGAESDNVINVGAGTDEIVLGTGAVSNDTVEFTGYNNGVNTIVNFTDGVVEGGSGSTAATPEQQTIDFTGVTVAATGGGGDITVGGVNVTVADGDNAATIAGKVQAAVNGAITDNATQPVTATVNNNVVTIEYDTDDGNAAQIALADGTATFDNAGGVGDASVTDNAQAYNAGGGANAGNDGDILDFTSYLGGDAGTVTTAVGAYANDGDVSVISDFNTVGTGDNAVSFDDLSGSNMLAALNGDNSTPLGTAFSGFSAVNGAAGDGATDYILMVENGANDGEYKAFHLTSNAESTDFSSVQLIGTLDFGAEQTFDATNFA